MNIESQKIRSRPLLSRSGCIFLRGKILIIVVVSVLVPFYRGAVVFDLVNADLRGADLVLVPFYRGAVVFPSGSKIDLVDAEVLVPFYRGAVVFKTVNHLY